MWRLALKKYQTESLSILRNYAAAVREKSLLGVHRPEHDAFAEFTERDYLTVQRWLAQGPQVANAKELIMAQRFAEVSAVNWRLKRYQSLALQTVPVGESEPGLGQVVLFALRFFGRRPGWRFGTV